MEQATPRSAIIDDTTASATAGTLADRAAVRLAGEDVHGFLQGLVTNDVAGTLPVWTGLLTPQGKALFDFLIWAAGDDLLLDVEATEAEAIIRRLSIYRLRRAITIAVDPTIAVHWSPVAPAAASAVRDPRLPALGFRWLAAPGPAAVGWHQHRLAHGVTEGVGDLGRGETLWLECNARELDGVSFTKGCYVGQENTARMHHRAKVNRRLVVAPLSTPGDRTRSTYPDLNLMVEHRRVDALGDALLPSWLGAAIAVSEATG